MPSLSTGSLHAYGNAAVALMLMMFASACENDVGRVKEYSGLDTLPVETAQEIEMIYSDSGNVKIWMASPEMIRYEGRERRIIFPSGVRVIFYAGGLREESVLTSRYAMINEQNGMMEARNDVRLINQATGESLNTERLIWDQKKKLIFSDEFVKVTSGGKVLYGHGFESDQTFENWTIRRPTGSIDVNPE